MKDLRKYARMLKWSRIPNLVFRTPHWSLECTVSSWLTTGPLERAAEINAIYLLAKEISRFVGSIDSWNYCATLSLLQVFRKVWGRRQ